jgi:hypothetical protein
MSLTLSIVALLSGCAFPHVTQAVKPSDTALSCNQIDIEMVEAERFREDALKAKGVTGTNVAAVIFFWPAMFGTYSNANDAIAAADNRKAHLAKISTEKKCAERAQDANAVDTSNIGKGEKDLNDLKRMLDTGLITKEEYEEKRAKVLSGM